MKRRGVEEGGGTVRRRLLCGSAAQPARLDGEVVLYR